ncbi:hypothetical protein AJ87_11545 [Rhizobium yanglingense]|nr:hypothetical protein AJ87_11545 [Rhizobium yanglingense]
MGIRKPALSAVEAKRLAAARIGVSEPDLQAVADKSPARPLLDNIHPEDSRRPLTDVRCRRQSDQRSIPTVDALSSTAVPEKIQVFLSARPPAREVSAVFDRLILQYSPVKSLQMILRRALDDYEAMLEDGSFRMAPKSYPVPQTASEHRIVAQTSRMFPVLLVEVARAHFDPLGLETGRAFGRKIATAALACFFSAEKKFDR